MEDANVKETPRRFAKYILGFGIKSEDEMPPFTLFETESTTLTIVDNLSVKSMCAHHLAPFFGDCLVAYVPSGKIAGLSKFQRLLDYVAKQPCEQEVLTERFGKLLMDLLNPSKLMVIMKCKHTCMIVRGVENCNSATTTSFVRGEFLEDENLIIAKSL